MYTMLYHINHVVVHLIQLYPVSEKHQLSTYLHANLSPWSIAPEVNLIDSPGHVDFTSEAPWIFPDMYRFQMICGLQMRSSCLKINDIRCTHITTVYIYIYTYLYNIYIFIYIYIHMYICIDTCYLILYLHIHIGCHKFYHLIFYYMYSIFHDSMVPGLHRCAAGRRCPGRSGLRGRRRGADAHRAAAGASEFHGDFMGISCGFHGIHLGYHGIYRKNLMLCPDINWSKDLWFGYMQQIGHHRIWNSFFLCS